MNSEYRHWTYHLDADGIFWLSLDKKNASMNTLCQEVLGEFSKIVEYVETIQSTLKALVLKSGKSSGFIAGADVSQFGQLKDIQQATDLIRSGQDLFTRFESLKVPTIAMIEGFCLGGGLELSMCCRYRIALDDDKTKLGLPEVKLGLHPGWGGTIRAIRLLGPLKGFEIMLTGQMLASKKASKLGLVQAAVPKRLLLQTVRLFALNPPKQYASVNHYAPKHGWMQSAPVRLLIGKFLLSNLNKRVKREHYPAPFVMVENWIEEGISLPSAMLKEASSMANLLVSPTAKNLLRVFNLNEGLKLQGSPKDFQGTRVHVIGSGVMGGDIAIWCALRGFSVTLQDLSLPLIGKAMGRASALAAKRLREPHLISAMMDRLQPDPEGLGVKHADVIIEAITENIEIKRACFAKIEAAAKPDAIIATNTSTLLLEEIAKGMTNGSRLVGIHFFNPVEKMPLVEIIHAANTDPLVVKRACGFVRRIDKLPLPVRSSPGFVVNRILLPYMLEAISLVDEGVPGPFIDAAALQFGMPMGPIELADTVGLDVCLAALEGMSAIMPTRIPEELKQLVANKHLGRKTGSGFYQYKGSKVIKPKPLANALAPSDIIERLTGRMFNEVMAVLREGVVAEKDLLDAGCIFGFGFPPFLGGPLHYIESHGQDTMKEMLVGLKNKHGERFALDASWTG